MRNATQSKENKLTAVLGTAEICQLFLFGSQKCHNKECLICFYEDSKMGSAIFTFCIFQVIVKKKHRKIQLQ